MKSKLPISASLLGVVVMMSPLSSHAATVVSSSFSGITGAAGAISTTGALDWGYLSVQNVTNQGLFHAGAVAYTNTPFDNIDNIGGGSLTTVSGSSAIGSVTLNEIRPNLSAQTNTPIYTFDTNQAYGAYGNFGGTNDNIWSLTFNDLGIGTRNITLYMGHTRNDRRFQVDYNLTGATPGQTDSGRMDVISSFSAPLYHFIYEIEVETTAADDDLTLTFGSISGNSGGGVLAGYTVTGTIAAIPEPSSAALLGLAGMAILIRRRR